MPLPVLQKKPDGRFLPPLIFENPEHSFPSQQGEGIRLDRFCDDRISTNFVT